MCKTCGLNKFVYIAYTDEQYEHYRKNIDSKKTILIDKRNNLKK